MITIRSNLDIIKKSATHRKEGTEIVDTLKRHIIKLGIILQNEPQRDVDARGLYVPPLMRPHVRTFYEPNSIYKMSATNPIFSWGYFRRVLPEARCDSVWPDGWIIFQYLTICNNEN